MDGLGCVKESLAVDLSSTAQQQMSDAYVSSVAFSVAHLRAMSIRFTRL